MTAVSCDAHVAAPPNKVFDVFSAIDRAADRVSGIKRIERLTPSPVGVGTRFKETRVMFGKEATEEMTFTAFDPGRGYTLGAESSGCRYIINFRFEPDGTGTRVTASFTAQPLSTMAKVMGVLMGWMMKRMLTKCLRKDMDELKAAAETDG
jgi:carbon monoxide dehydrogenase subunit G